MSIRTKLLVVLGLFAAVVAVLTGTGIYGTETMANAVDGLVTDEVAQLQLFKAVSDDFAVAIVDNAHKTRNGEVSWEQALATVESSRQDIATRWEAYSKMEISGDEVALVADVRARMSEASAMLDHLVGILKAHSQEELVSLIQTELYQRIDPITAGIDKLIELQDESAAAKGEASRNAETLNTWVQGGMVLTSLVVLLFGGLVIIRTVAGRLGKMQQALAEVAGGNLETAIPYSESSDEIGRIAKSAEVFRQNGLKIRELTEAERANAEAAALARRKMMSELRAAFGSVVDAAVAGNFGSRVAAAFADDELNGLAQSVNLLVQTVDNGLTEAGDVLTALANTDLTARVGGEYQGAFGALKDNVNAVADNLTDVVGRLRATSTGVKMATSELLEGANDLSERTTKQAATIEETSATMEQLSNTVAQNARSAETASRQALAASQAAEDGGAVMRNATAAMERITASSSKISNIIGLIDDIAFQTNLLALNASVEAARAGEAGKGFAVVAVEVRRLAQNAAQASSEVKALIEQSGQEVKSGSTLVDDAANKLTAMMTMVRDSAEAMAGIARASSEQANAIGEITSAVRQMDDMTQHNAALVEETNAAIEQTENQARELDSIVGQFRVADAGHAAPSRGNFRKITTKRTAKPAKAYSRPMTDGSSALAQDWSEF